MTPSEEYELYGDRPAPEAAEKPDATDSRSHRAAPPCPGCGANDHEDGFVEGTSDSLVRYYAGPRSVGLFGVKRFGLVRRPVLARRCRVCSRLDLYAGDEE